MGVPTAKAPGEHSEGGLVSTAVGAARGAEGRANRKQKQRWRLFPSSRDLGARGAPLVPGGGGGCGVRAGVAALQLGLAGQELKWNVEGPRRCDPCG